MRIAIAYDCLFPWSTGGGERQYRRFAEEFAAAGHEVTYLTRQFWPDAEPPSIDGIRIVAVSAAFDLYDANGTRRPGPALRYARGLFTHLRHHRTTYDAILVSALPTTNALATRAALAGSNVTIAADWLEVWEPAQWREYAGPITGRIATALQRLAARLSPIATCHSQLSANRLKNAGLRTDPLISPGLIDLADTAPPTFTAPPRAIFIGRHIPDKRVETLPAAIAAARIHLPALTATIYGDGPTKALVQAEINRLGLAAVIDLPGFVSQPELNAAIRSAACVVNPSAREGYGLVVVEACAAGTPLRKTTYAWFTQASQTKTITATAEAILTRLTEAKQT
ncbi:glycosyltransferase family 4 protein [Amycolatopsis silviterrae]|uniref:Glycosyltransferase family 4 protein n=1 Tax=Amycolatopsis silviterrae TaxID=1656914 RepID=A0ABW5H6T3_9PSEU